ncbi:MAG: glycoside hydrolase 43 family protein [Bryobacteraceae bacterium]|nr:glycoside hydrolase 43 family protein [Bryobacteraceae bacterium]
MRALAPFLPAALLLSGAPASAAAERYTWRADNGNGTFTNPLFFDEFSDPDLIRVGQDFYLTGTTMHSMPGLPVLHSRDLVNWTFLSYVLDRLDLGPSFRLEDGKNEYGRGIWAPCLRYHKGVFYIFSNVNGQTAQTFRATDPRGPWKRIPMKRSLHDLSVLFDDDGRTYVVWGYRGIRLAQLNEDLTDLVPGTEREIIPPAAGMGEGLHFYKIRGRYYITSAWFLDEMRMPVARADRLDGPWEVNQDISRGEDFGLALGHRVAGRTPPFRILPPDPSQRGRCAIHQGGIVDTPKGEWWGFSMMDANSVGRLTALSPVTWKDGWPYFGLPGNLGRSPRTWIKPDTGHRTKPRAPFERSDDFARPGLNPVWQWNHVPVDGKWSLRERPGWLRLHALPAPDLWSARNTLTQRAVGPRSTATAVLDAAGLAPGAVAGFALFNRPWAWIGVERSGSGFALVQFDEATGESSRVPLAQPLVWLRAACDFLRDRAQFFFSTDGRNFTPVGKPHTMAYGLITFQGVRWALFSFQTRAGQAGGYADFDRFDVEETPRPPVPVGRRIRLEAAAGGAALRIAGAEEFLVVDLRSGRVALRAPAGFVSIGGDGQAGLRAGTPGEAETFQWMETFDGDVILLSLATHRYLRVEDAGGRVFADSPGPRPDGRDGIRFRARFR